MRILPIVVVTSIVAASSFGIACGSSNADTASSTDDGGGAETSVPQGDGGGGGDGDAAKETGPAPYPAFVPTDIPQVATVGGPVMATPKVVPIFFASDDATTPGALTDFVAKVGATAYWKAAVGEYGVGALTGLAPVKLTAADNPAATIDDSQIRAWLAAKLNADDPAFPKPDANTIYALFYPANVTITISAGGAPPGDAGAGDAGGGDAGGGDAGSPGGGGVQSCVAGGFGGYHDNITLDAAHNSMDVAYAVLPRCPLDPALPNITTVVDGTAAYASHEFAEAVTDPFYSTNPAYDGVDPAHRYWMRVLGGGEVGDMCAFQPSSFTKFPELSYTVQRIWSNKAAMTGGDPCLPEPQGFVYFNTFPETSEAITGADGGATSVKGVNIPLNGSKTIDLDLFSMAPTSGPWTVTAYDGQQLLGGSPMLKFSYDKTQGQNGDKIKLTINVVAVGQRRKQETYLIVSKLDGVYAVWAGVVGSY